MDFANDQELLKRIRRHFVALGGIYVELDQQGRWKSEEKPFCYSGFVIEICGRWCFMTADHVFKDIDNWISKGRIKLLKCGLADYFSAEAKVKEPLHFAYEDVHKIPVDQGGMDLGLIPLRDYYCMNLKANGVLPLSVAPWKDHSPPPFDYYALLGLPEEEMELQDRIGARGPQVGYSMNLSLVGVQALECPPPDRVVSPIPRFAGVLLDDRQLDSVKGMSGGPILGISKVEGTWHCSCVAVQGSWDEGRRLIYGTPVSIVVEGITRLLLSEGTSAE